MPDRFYLTTAIAYANNKPGLHTLYEVIGADVDRPLAPDEGRRHPLPDRHRRALGQHRPARGRARAADTRDFVDEKVALFKAAEDALAIAAGPLHPDDRSRPRPGRPGDGPPGVRERRHLPRHVRGLVLPERGLPSATDVLETARGTICPNHPDVAAPVADRAELVLPPVGLPGAARAPLRGASGLRPARLPAQRDARLHPPAASRTSRSAASGRPAAGASRSRSPRTARPPSARTARGIPRPARSTSGSTR